MHLKWKGNTFSISLNGILSKKNSKSQTSFDNWEKLANHYKGFSVLLIHQPVKPHTVGGSFARSHIKYIYSDIISIYTGMVSLLVNSEQLRWQTWSHTHVDVCQCHSSRLIAANGGQSESLILFTCLSRLTFWF